MTREEIIDRLISERVTVLERLKRDLEEQLTQATGQEIELPQQFEDQRREKLAGIIKELNLLTDETLVVNIGNVNTGE